MKAQDMLARIELMMRRNTFSPEHPGSRSALLIDAVWRKAGKVVVQLDDDLAGELISHAGLKDDIDTRVLRQLMLVNPLVLFSEPVEVETPEGWRELLYGFYVYGKTGERACLTNAPEMTDIGIQVMSEIFPPDDELIFESRRVSVPVDMGRATIGDLALAVAHRYVSHFGATRDEMVHAISSALFAAIPILLYLSTDDCDVQFPRWSPARKKQAKQNKEVPIGKLGWRVGAALKAARLRYERDRATAPTGMTVRPHQRRGHFALRHTGPGRSVPKMVWVRPTWVHVDAIDGSGGTIRPAR